MAGSTALKNRGGFGGKSHSIILLAFVSSHTSFTSRPESISAQPPNCFNDWRKQAITPKTPMGAESLVMQREFSPIDGTPAATCPFSLDVLRLAAAPLANGAHHLPSIPRCSVCSRVLARVGAVSPRSRVPQRSTLCSFVLHLDGACRFSRLLWHFLRIQRVTSSKQNKS